MSTISDAFKKDDQIFFLVEVDFNGWKQRYTTKAGGASVENSGGNPLLFDGIILNTMSVAPSFDMRSFRYTASSIQIELANEDRFQDNETSHKPESGKGKIWAWSPSLDWSDIEDYPIFHGSFEKLYHTKERYVFQLSDFSKTSGKTVTTFTMSGHPADIVQTLAHIHSKLTLAEIGFEGFNTLKEALGGWYFETTIDSRANAFDVIDRILWQCRCARIQRWGQMGAVAFDVDAPTTGDLRDADGASLPKFSLTPPDLVCNNLSVSYNQSAGSWTSTITEDRTNNEQCNRSYADYDESEQKQLLLADCASHGMAHACIYRYFEWYAFRHHLVEWRVPYSAGWDLLEGHVAELTLEDGPSSDGAGWLGERCILLQRGFHQDFMSQLWWQISP